MIPAMVLDMIASDNRPDYDMWQEPEERMRFTIRAPTAGVAGNRSVTGASDGSILDE